MEALVVLEGLDQATTSAYAISAVNLVTVPLAPVPAPNLVCHCRLPLPMGLRECPYQAKMTPISGFAALLALMATAHQQPAPQPDSFLVFISLRAPICKA